MTPTRDGCTKLGLMPVTSPSPVRNTRERGTELSCQAPRDPGCHTWWLPFTSSVPSWAHAALLEVTSNPDVLSAKPTPLPPKMAAFLWLLGTLLHDGCHGNDRQGGR